MSDVTAPPLDLPEALALDRLRAIRAASADTVHHTPLLTARSLSERCGTTVLLKAESLQRTGSFKLRGALAKLRAIGGAEAPGVVAGSAGNHAQALAYAARATGVPCQVVMPVDAAVAKVAAVRAFGAQVIQAGETVDDCVARARVLAEERGFCFVHPFDDLDVIAGQAGLGLELLEDAPEAGVVLVPIGGGGLAAGVGAALRQSRPDVRIVGVQARACAAMHDALAAARGDAPAAPRADAPTIADGIAIKRPGRLTLPLLRTLLDDVVTVGEEEIADAMLFLMERSKLVVEGAGAVGVAALMSGTLGDLGAPAVAVLSGGNVDGGVLAAVAARGETRAGRRTRLFTRVADRPGGLAGLLAVVAQTRANVLAVEHVRDGVELDVRETGVELVLATTGPDHAAEVRARLRAAGYETKTIETTVVGG